MMSPDERLKELKKQGYISGVMAGKRIRARMNERLEVEYQQQIESTLLLN